MENHSKAGKYRKNGRGVLISLLLLKSNTFGFIIYIKLLLTIFLLPQLILIKSIEDLWKKLY